MNLLTPEPGLVFWMLLSFGIVLFVLGKFGFPVIVNMIDKRKNYIDESLKSAEAANAQLAGIKEEGERILNKAQKQQNDILNEAQEMRKKIILDAEKEAFVRVKKMIDDAQESIEKEKENAIREIQNQIAALSINIAEKVLRKNLEDKPAQQEFIDKLVQEAQENK